MLETQTLENHYSDEIRQLENFIYHRTGLLMENAFPMLDATTNPTVLHHSSYSIVVRFEADEDTTKIVKIFAPRVQTVQHLEHSRKRFNQEIKIQHLLSTTSPTVPKIHQILKSPHDNKTYGFVGEYIRGHNLENLSALPNFDRRPTNIAPLVLQLLHFFTHMESQNILHRDIKPANIILADDGYARVIDFGLARIKTDPCRITNPGVSLGTADYTAPEIFSSGTYDSDGISNDHQCDIYSFGTMIEEILNCYWDGGWARAQYPSEFLDIIEKCTAQNPNDRYQSFSSVYRDFYTLIQTQRQQKNAS